MDKKVFMITKIVTNNNNRSKIMQYLIKGLTDPEEVRIRVRQSIAKSGIRRDALLNKLQSKYPLSNWTTRKLSYALAEADLSLSTVNQILSITEPIKEAENEREIYDLIQKLDNALAGVKTSLLDMVRNKVA